MPRSSNSTSRRRKLADFISSGFPAMRPCQACLRAQVLCVTVPSSEKCEQCTRFGRPCDLASPVPQLERLSQEKDRIVSKIQEKRRITSEVNAAILRLRKQRRLIQKRMKELGDKEYQNIFELEVDEMLAEVVVRN